MGWQSGGHSPIHKTIQAQSEIKAVHAQGTVRAVQAQAEIIGITRRMETVAKRLTRSAAGGRYWKKAAIEQAGLLDKMLDVAKASENDQLIAAVRKVFGDWAEGHPHYRAALGSGMTISECLAMALAGKQPEQNVAANSSNHPGATTHPVITTNKVSEKAAYESSVTDWLVLRQKHTGSVIGKPTFWSAFFKTAVRNLIFPAIGCALMAIVYTLAVGKAMLHPKMIVSSAPTLEAPMPVPATPTPTATPISDRPPTTPTPQAEAPKPSVQTKPTLARQEQEVHGKLVHKRRVAHN
jgi:hypothetical protein